MYLLYEHSVILNCSIKIMKIRILNLTLTKMNKFKKMTQE